MNETDAEFDFPISRFNCGEFSLAYRDLTPELSAKTPTILCVHGNPTWSFYYRSVARRFAERFRVVLVDHLGCGDSDKPPRNKFTYTLADHTSNLVALIEHLNLDDTYLLAHDWGGAIGLGSVVRCRDRFSGIMLLNTAAFPPPYIPWRIAACRFPLLGTIAVRGLNLFARAAVTMAMNRTKMHPRVAKGLLQPYDNWHNRVAIDAFVRDIPFSRKGATFDTLQQLESDLPSLSNLPSLLIWGMKDWCFRPECLRRLQQVWPSAEAMEIADAGHYVIEDAPTETLDAIDCFLKRHTVDQLQKT